MHGVSLPCGATIIHPEGLEQIETRHTPPLEGIPTTRTPLSHLHLSC